MLPVIGLPCGKGNAGHHTSHLSGEATSEAGASPAAQLHDTKWVLLSADACPFVLEACCRPLKSLSDTLSPQNYDQSLCQFLCQRPQTVLRKLASWWDDAGFDFMVNPKRSRPIPLHQLWCAHDLDAPELSHIMLRLAGLACLDSCGNYVAIMFQAPQSSTGARAQAKNASVDGLWSCGSCAVELMFKTMFLAPQSSKRG